MANTKILWNIPAGAELTTVLDTSLAGLLNTAVVTSSAVYTNRTDLFQYAQFELVATASVFPANGYANVWLVTDMGSGYETVVANVGLARPADAILPLHAITGSQTVTSPMLAIPPDDFKVAFQSYAGVTLSTITSSLRMLRFIDRAVGE